MLTFTALDIQDGFAPNWKFDCPSCGKPVRFYSVAQRQCGNCLNHLPFEPGQLTRSTEARVEYYVKNN